MASMRSVLLSLIVSTVPLLAAEPPMTFSSRLEAQRFLFGNSTRTGDPLPTNLLMGEDGARKKSVGLAAIYSLVLPGMGELYAEGFGSGRYFLVAEGALWLTYAVFDIYGNSLRDDARTYAVSRAGVNPAGKNDQFYVDVGNFMDVEAYNDKKLRDREPDKLYDPAAGYGWRWESDQARATFKDQRIASENAFNNRKFVIAAVVINHIASAINAARSAISYNNALEETLGSLSIGANVMGGLANPHGIMLTLQKEF